MNIAFLCLLLLISFPAYSNLNVSVTESPKIYRALDQLIALGLIDDVLRGQRPWPQSEVARMIAQAKQHTERLKGDEAEFYARTLIKQIEQEMRLENAKEKSFTVEPLNKLQLEYLFLDSPFRSTPENKSGSKIDALVNPLITYRSGRPYQDGQNFSMETAHQIHLGRYFSISGQPQFFLRHPVLGEDDFDWNFDHLYLRGEFKNIGVQFGRDALVWGFSPEGGNFFTTNARGLDMFKISNIHPFQLPWIFKYLGKMNLSFFFGVLGVDREFSHPYITGYKFSFLPHKNFEWAFTSAVMSGGQGSPKASIGARVFDTFLGYIPNIAGGESPIDNFASNRIGGFEFLLRIPKWRGTEIYYEVTLEDLNTQYKFFHEAFNRVGLYLPRISFDGRHNLRLEYKRSGFLPYRHNQFISGWTHHQRLLGDDLGPDGQSVSLVYGYNPTFNWNHKIHFTWEKRDSDNYFIPASGSVQRTADNPEEERWRLLSSFSWRMTKHFETTFDFGYEYLRQFNFVPGNNENNFLTSLRLAWLL